MAAVARVKVQKGPNLPFADLQSPSPQNLSFFLSFCAKTNLSFSFLPIQGALCTSFISFHLLIQKEGKSFAGQTLIASCRLVGNPTDRSKLVTSKSIDTSIKLSLWIISLPFEINWSKRVSKSKAVLHVKKQEEEKEMYRKSSHLAQISNPVGRALARPKLIPNLVFVHVFLISISIFVYENVFLMNF